MIKLASRRAAVVLGGSALALAGGLLPAQAATSGWRINTTFAIRGGSNILTSVSAASPSDAWATGIVVKTTGNSLPQPFMRHWTGTAWRPVTLPAKIARQWANEEPIFSEVGVVSASNVWVFGGVDGGYLRLNGGRWSLGRLPSAGGVTSGGGVYIDAVKVFSKTNVWAFGAELSVSGSQPVATPYAARYNGRKWVPVSVPGSGAIAAVSAASPKDMWAVEGGLSFLGNSIAPGPKPSVVLHWNPGTGWQPVQSSLAAGDQLTSVVAEPNGDVWFGGSATNRANGTTPLAAEWNGTTKSWSVSDLPMRATSAAWSLSAMTPDGTGGIWALAQAGKSGNGRIWHLRGAHWSQVSPAFGKRPWILEALTLVPGTHSVWAVGAVKAGRSSADGLIAVDGPMPR